MRKPKKGTTPITINIPTELLKEFDARSEKDGINRTAQIIIAMRNYLDSSNAFQYLPQLLNALQNSNKS